MRNNEVHMPEKTMRLGRTLKNSSLAVAEIMSTDAVSIEPNRTASFASSQMRRHDTAHLIVMENGRLRGVVSERDLGGARGAGIRTGRIVQDLMIPNAVSVEPQTTLGEAAKVILKRQISVLPVVEDGQLVGIVTATDVLDELGRSSTRARFPGWLPKVTKREAGRNATIAIPAHIRVSGHRLSRAKREDIRRKLGFKLGKYGSAIERVTVRFTDVNGPRGGIDQLCRIKVVLSELPSVVVESKNNSTDAAAQAALAATERAVRRRLQRRRTKPIKKQARPAFVSAG
jgi:CBS domain-containing protein